MVTFTEGMKVQVISVEETRDNIGLDSQDEMKGMIGKTFPVYSVQTNKVYIKGPTSGYYYCFISKDVRPVDFKEPDPIIFEFDIKNLDI